MKCTSDVGGEVGQGVERKNDEGEEDECLDGVDEGTAAIRMVFVHEVAEALFEGGFFVHVLIKACR